MKKNPLLGVIGCGLVAGAAYLLTKYINKDDPMDMDKTSDKKEESTSLSPDLSSENVSVDVDTIKTQAVSSIYNRHKEASEIAREAIDNINSEPEEPSVHTEDFDSMIDDLNSLLEGDK